MKRNGWLLIGVACAACCAPLLLPLLGASGLAGIGAAGAGLFAGLGPADIACAALGGGALAAGAALALREFARRRARKAAACEIGGACDPRSRG